MKLKRPGLAVEVVLAAWWVAAAVPCSIGQTVWTGPNITITHTSDQAANPNAPSSADQITANVWITRAPSLGIYNSVTQDSYGAHATEGSGMPDGSPSDTEWAVGSIDDYASLSYGSWMSALHGASGVGQPAVLHLITDNIYLSITFTSFSSGGIYSYVRSTFGAAQVVPSVSITSPADGTVLAAPAAFTIGADASATGGTVTNVDFLTNGVLAGTATAAPFSVSLSNVHVASYAITAVATAAGISATSAVVNIAVVPPPSVAITNPVPGAVLAEPANVLIAANASVVRGTITNVQFYNGATLLGSATAAPFAITANNLTAGPYALTAVATAAGLSTTSSVVNINVVVPVVVSNSAPVLAGGQFSFEYTANPGLTYIVKSSSDLVNWVPVKTNIAGGSLVLFQDTSSVGAQRFYEVVRQANP